MYVCTHVYIVNFHNSRKKTEFHGNKVLDICKPIVSDGNPVGKGFEQIVLNQVTEAIHIIHFVKNLIIWVTN